MIKYNKDELFGRVRKAKWILKQKKIKREFFFDQVYGSMYDAEHTRIVNLWQCKITDIDFTQKLESFVEFPESSIKTSAEFQRFMLFEKWYTSLGGEPLSAEQIESVYPKFKI